MTTKRLGRLNRYSVPGIAMTLDAILNMLLISYFGYPLDILAAGNLGYMLAHVFALSGFLLLRKDRPNWPRPIRLAAVWVPIAALLAAVNLDVHRRRRVHLSAGSSDRQLRLRLGQDPHRPDRARGGAAALHLAQRRRGSQGRDAARGDADDAARERAADGGTGYFRLWGAFRSPMATQ